MCSSGCCAVCVKAISLLYTFSLVTQLHLRHHSAALPPEHQQIPHRARAAPSRPGIVVRPARLRVRAQHHSGRGSTAVHARPASAIAGQTGRPVHRSDAKVPEHGDADQSGCGDVLEHPAQAVRSQSAEYYARVSVHGDCAEQEAEIERGVLLSPLAVLVSE